MDKSNKKVTAKETPKTSLDSAKQKPPKESKESTVKSKHGTSSDSGGVRSRVQKVKNVFEGKSTLSADEDMDFMNDTGSIKERRLSDSSLKGVSWITSESSEEQEKFHGTAMRARSNTTNKEMWVPLAKTNKESDHKETEKEKSKKPTSPEPVKPPRPKRVDSFKRDAKDDKGEVKKKQIKKPVGKQGARKADAGIDPVKPPRRKLPRPPNTDVKTPKGGKHKEQKGELENEQEIRDIISRPVVTSTPFQENMTLSVEDVANDEKGRRLFSIYDDSTDTTVQQGQSFYDFLYSKEDKITESGAYGGNQVIDLRDENLYDDVPLDSSTQSLTSLGKRTDTDFDVYDEVIVNKGE